jgi:hypothetical protein
MLSAVPVHTVLAYAGNPNYSLLSLK